MVNFDKRLAALADCPVLPTETGGFITFSPNPVIFSENNLILAHEVCHRLAGKKDFAIFATAVKARDDSEAFHSILNLLTDWYHEYKYGHYSSYLWGQLDELHSLEFNAISLPVKIAEIFQWYKDRNYDQIKNVIMDSAIIIAESLRRKDVPISLLDVGVTNKVVNAIKQPLDLNWFTPMSEGGTPLGDVCSTITDADNSSYLLIITDGQPDDWKSLQKAVENFPGSYLTFVIGASYGAYMENIGNAVSVEPHTIVRELYNNGSLK